MRLKKLLAMLLTVVLLVSSTVIALPVSAAGEFVWDENTYANMTADADYKFSKDPDNDEYGNGSSDKPFIIATVQDLAQLACNVENAVASNYQNKYFLQVNDIDLGNISWPGIGKNYNTDGTATYAFKGHYNGGGFAIKNLKIDNKYVGASAASSAYAGTRVSLGLFGFVGFSDVSTGCLIENVNIVSGTIEVDGAEYVGALIGRVRNGVTVSNCSNTVPITVTNAKKSFGGLVGRAEGATWMNQYVTISNSYNGADVNITTSSNDTPFVGGIIGSAVAQDIDDKDSVTVNNCINYGDVSVTGVSATKWYAGGVIGFVSKTGSAKVGRAKITNITNVGNITLTSSNTFSRFGGLIGCLGHNEPGEDRPISAVVANCYDSGVLTVRGYANEFWYMGSIGQIQSNVKIDSNTTKDNYTSNSAYWFIDANETNIANANKPWTNKRVGEDLTESATESALVTNSFAQTNEKKKIDISALSMLPTGTTNVQYKMDNEVYCLRFSSELNLDNLKGIKDIGFLVDIGGASTANGYKLSGNKTVYSSLNALNGEQITPEGVGYIIAAGISNVPQTGTITFKVTPYVEFEDGTVAYGTQSKLVTVENGGEPVVSAE